MTDRRDAQRKPDAGPMRLALGVGGLATLSAITTAIVAPVAASGPRATSEAGGTMPPAIAVQRPVVYVTLKPGETPPPGARTISPTAPKPITIVTTVQAPPQRPVIVRTTQSGKVIP